MKTVALRAVTEKIGSGSTPRGGEDSYPESGTPLIRSLNVYDDGFREDGLAFLTAQQADALSSVTVESGDVLLNITGASVARCCLAPDRLLPARVNQHVCIIRPTKAALDPHYLQHLLVSGPTKRRLLRIGDSGGATRQAITKADLQSLEIPLPPLSEQKCIAAILDAADALRAKRRKSIEQLDSLIQATFLEMFGDPVTNPKEWAVESLGQVASNEDGKRVPVKKSDRENMQGRYPYYGASGVIDHVDDYLFEGERLLIGEDGANLLARSTPIAFRVHGKYWVNNHAHVLAENGEASLVFLETLINQLDLTQYVSGSAQPKLTQKSLNVIPIPTPPLDLQTRFASIVESIEQQKTRLKVHLAELDTLFASLQSRAFNGELMA